MRNHPRKKRKLRRQFPSAPSPKKPPEDASIREDLEYVTSVYARAFKTCIWKCVRYADAAANSYSDFRSKKPGRPR